MRRKVIQLAGKTAVISLPNAWIKKYNIKKGEELELTEEHNKILIETTKETTSKDVTIDISEMNASTAWYTLISKYRSGANQINLYYNDYIHDVKTDSKIKSIDLIQDAARKLIGMEIIKQDKNHAILKEITKPKEEELDNVIKRIYFTLLNMSTDIINSIEDKEKLKNISITPEENVNKLSNFSLRLITKKPTNNYNTLLTYSTILKLEELGDHYANISKILSDTDKANKEIINILILTDKMLKEFYDISYKHNQEKHNNMIVLKHKIKKEIENYKPKNEQETKILQTIKNIPNLLMEASCIKLS